MDEIHKIAVAYILENFAFLMVQSRTPRMNSNSITIVFGAEGWRLTDGRQILPKLRKAGICRKHTQINADIRHKMSFTAKKRISNLEICFVFNSEKACSMIEIPPNANMEEHSARRTVSEALQLDALKVPQLNSKKPRTSAIII